MRGKVAHLLCLVLLLLVAACSNTKGASELSELVHEYTLPNGMRWLLVPRRQAPVFSGVVMVRVGGTDEVEGKAGIAHMLEHMAFKGSKMIGTSDWEKERPILDKIARVGRELTKASRAAKPDKAEIDQLSRKYTELKKEHERYYIKNEIWELVSRNGGHDLNAYTSKDVTAYHVSMPINRLELWATIISQMVKEPVFREFYTERNVVAEERRSDFDNNPNGKMTEILLGKAFQHGPYKWSTIGPEEDILSYLQEDAKAFQEKYYVPARMVGVIVGDIDVGRTKRMIRRYFGDMPRGINPPEPKTAPNAGGGTTTFYFDAQPALVMAYHKPTLPDPEEYAFDVATSLLCYGPTSRLYRKLVIEDKIARGVSCSDAFPGSRLPNLFLIWVEPMNGTNPEKIIAEIEAELDGLKKGDASQKELERVRTKIAASFLFELETNMGLAQSLAQFETIFNDWKLMATYPDHVADVTAADVRALAKKYFTESNRTIVIRKRKK
jgi:predicted Zn-dependent peptidase